jgi:NAD(P)-dependent dehydrogenase (short-subunit alcohol dehydrogenase family)
MISPPEHNNGKVAIITGASQGIGAGLTKAYRERGYAVIVAARSIEQPEDSGIVAVAGDIADLIPRCTPSVGWARSRTLSVECSISSRRLS